MKRSSLEVVLAPKVLEAFAAIPDPGFREDIMKRVDGLQKSPADQGRALTGELSGFYVIRNSEAGYRIIYRVEGDRVVIYAVTIDTGRTMMEPSLHSLARRLVTMKMYDAALMEALPVPEPGMVQYFKPTVESKMEKLFQEDLELEPELGLQQQLAKKEKRGASSKSLRKTGKSAQAKKSKKPKESKKPKKRKKRGGKSDEHNRK